MISNEQPFKKFKEGDKKKRKNLYMRGEEENQKQLPPMIK